MLLLLLIAMAQLDHNYNKCSESAESQVSSRVLFIWIDSILQKEN